MISLCMCAFISHRCCAHIILRAAYIRKASERENARVSHCNIFKALLLALTHGAMQFDVPHIMRYILARTHT